MRSKRLQLFFERNNAEKMPSYHYRPSNLDFEFEADGITLSRQTDIVGYNSQFDALSFSLTAMKDAGVDINHLKGIAPMPYSAFKSVSVVSNSDVL